jgi:dolichyl-phosphate beta-glucosyltransferase
MEISVIVPAYNEEHRIEPTLQKLIDYLSKKAKRFEIIVVDDHSLDDTRKLAEKYKKNHVKILHNERNVGKGFSIRKGVMHAKYPLILFTDSDLATPIQELSKLTKYIKSYDVVIASRNMRKSVIKTHQPPLRRILGKVFPICVNMITFCRFKDTQCGFKLFKKEAAKKIFSLQTMGRFSFDVEILFIARRLKYKIKEVPVIWIDQKGSTVNPIKDSIRMLIDLFKIRYKSLTGKYNER